MKKFWILTVLSITLVGILVGCRSKDTSMAKLEDLDPYVLTVLQNAVTDVINRTSKLEDINAQLDRDIKINNINENELMNIRREAFGNVSTKELKKYLEEQNISATEKEIDLAIKHLCIVNSESMLTSMKIKLDELKAEQMGRALKVWIIDRKFEGKNIPSDVVLYSDLEDFLSYFSNDNCTADAYINGTGSYYVKITDNGALIIVAGSAEEAIQNLDKEYSTSRVGVIYTVDLNN